MNFICTRRIIMKLNGNKKKQLLKCDKWIIQGSCWNFCSPQPISWIRKIPRLIKNHAGEIAVTVIYCRHRRGAIYQFYIITPRNFIHKRRESEFHHRRAARNYTHMNNLASCAHLEGSHLKIAIIRWAHPSPQDESENFAEWCKKLKRHAAPFYITLALKQKRLANNKIYGRR